MNHKRFTTTGRLGLLRLAAILLLLLTVMPEVTFAADLTVCTTGPPDCQYASIQDAVDAANPGDVIRVAGGEYTGVHKRRGLAQVVYLDKTVTIRGGYTAPDFSEPPDPWANPTTLDAQGRGRVVYISRNIEPTVEGLRITGGKVAGAGLARGGGVYVDRASATLSGNRVFANSAVFGGGLYLKGSNAILRDNAIFGNLASTNGGGVLLDNHSAAMLRDNGIYGNVAASGGGLDLWQSPATLSGNTISGNTANESGGGVQLRESEATLRGNTIWGNTANDGGGLLVWQSPATLTANIIAGNTATDNGGGLHLNDSHATLTENTIISNTASYNGGGLSLGDSNATLANNIVAENEATYGSGVFIRSSSPQLLHTTIARNGGGTETGVLVAGGSSLVSINTILVGHSLGIWVEGGSTASLKSTLWGSGVWANGTDWSGDGVIDIGTINLWADPLFVDPYNHDYHIGPGSGAIDAGVGAGVRVDIDGESRPYGAGYDIGADEWVAE